MDAKSFFEENGWLDADGKYTADGLKQLALLISRLPKIHEGMWRDCFLPIMSLVVAASCELVIVRGGKVLLVWREDAHYRGWHTPGGYIGPGESRQASVTRIASKELGCDPQFVRIIEAFIQDDNPRLPDESNLFLCTLPDGVEPAKGQWFDQCPPDILVHHRKFWEPISKYLK